MANNVPITAGAGTSVATDDVSGVHYQVVKLALGDEDVATRVTSSNPLPITGTLTLSGEDHIGQVGGHINSYRFNPTITAGAYSANDVIAGELTLTNAVRTSGGSAVLQSLTIHDKAAQGVAMHFYLFDAAPSAALADNAAWAWTDGDEDKWLGTVYVASTDWVAAAGDSFVTKNNIGLAVSANGSQNLFLYIVTTGTPTYAGTLDLTFSLRFLTN